MGFFKKIKKFVSELMSLPPEQEIKPQQGSRPAAQPSKAQEAAKPLPAIPMPPVAQIEETAFIPKTHEAVKAAVKAPSATEKVDTKPHGVTPAGASQNKPREKAAKPVDQKEKPVKQVQDTPALPRGVKISGDYLYHVIKKDNTATILKYVGRSSEKKLVIPAELDGHIVDTIGKAAFSNYKGESYPRLDLKTAQEKYAIAQECTFQGTTIHLPETIETIDDFAYHGAVSLQKVVFPKKMKKIGKYSFYGCSELKTAHFPDELEELAYHSFEDCVKLTDVDLPATLETLQYSTFKGCSALRTLRFPDQLNKIENSVFENCISLQNVQLPSTLTTVNYNIFKGCSNLSSIELMSSDSESPFYSLDGVLYAKNKRLISYPEGKTDSIFALPEGTTGIDNGGFAGNTHIKEVKLPKSFRIMRWRAFNGCINLEKLELPHRKALQANEHDFFDGCDKLTVYIQEGSLNEQMIKEINEKLLEKDRRAITYAIIHKDGSTSHPERMLTVSETLDPTGNFQINNKKVLIKYLGKAEHVIIPHGVLEIGEYAFKKNTTIQSVEIPDSVEVIQYAAFSDCHGLLDIHLPDSIAKIEFSAFSGCSGLKTVRLPSSLRIIEKHTFFLCEQLTELVIPEGILEIKDSAFSWCESLQHISLPTSLVTIEKGAFYGCEALAEVRIPEGVTRIEDETFKNCDALNSVILPETLISIGDGAFEDCHTLAEIFIPHGVLEIGSKAFAGCYDLADIYLPDSVTRIGANVFMSAYNRTIHTVRGSYAAKYAQENKIEVAYDYPSGLQAASFPTSRRFAFNSPSQPNAVFDEEFPDEGNLDEEVGDEIDAGSDTDVARQMLLQIRAAFRGDQADLQDEGVYEEGRGPRRVNVDKAFSIEVPEGYIYTTDPDKLINLDNSRVLAMMLDDGSAADFMDIFDATENVTAMRLKVFDGRYIFINTPIGHEMVELASNLMLKGEESYWEEVTNGDIIVCFSYDKPDHFQHRFTAGVFTDDGIFQLQLFYRDDQTKAECRKKALKVLESIGEIEWRAKETQVTPGATSYRAGSPKHTLDQVQHYLGTATPRYTADDMEFNRNLYFKEFTLGSYIHSAASLGVSTRGLVSSFSLSNLNIHTKVTPFPLKGTALSYADKQLREAPESLAFYVESVLIQNAMIFRMNDLNLLQSFAWCMHAYSQRSNIQIQDVEIEEMLHMCTIIEARHYAFFKQGSHCSQLCGISALGNAFVPFDQQHEEARQLLAEGTVKAEKLGNLFALREELASLQEPIRKISDYMISNRNADASQTKNLRSILCSWSAFCVGADQAFIVSEGQSVEV